MDVSVRLEISDGRVVDARPGDFVGRLPSATVRINDPRISEAHALVSLRQRKLLLLALRSRLGVGGESLSEVPLEPGLVIQLAPGLTLDVLSVTLPDTVLALSGPGLPARALPPVATVRVTGPYTELLPGLHTHADALVWHGGDGFVLQVGQGQPTPIEAGDRVFIGGTELVFVALPIGLADVDATRRDLRDAEAPLTLVLRYDTVHVHRGAEVATIDGRSARLLTELAQRRTPIAWHSLAELVWPEGGADLRARFDRTITRLRKRLEDLGLRRDLVHSDAQRHFTLALRPQDRVRDET